METERSFMLGAGLCLLLMGFSLPAQDVDPRVADLETQRKLDAATRRLLREGKTAEAARTLVRMARLDHLVPPPFESAGDPRRAILRRALDARARFERNRRQRILEEERAGKPAHLPEELEVRLDEIVRSEYRGDKLERVLKRVLELSRDLETSGITEEYKWGRRLRRLVPYLPCLPSRLKSSQRKRLFEEWEAASMPARRDFLKLAVLEVLAWKRNLGFLAGKDAPSLARGVKEAQLVAFDFLAAAPEDHARRFVRTSVVLGKADAGEPPSALPCGRLLPIEGPAGGLLPVFVHTPSDQEAMLAGARYGLTPHFKKWVRSYPAKGLEKVLSRIAPETEVVLIGRVLPVPLATGSHVFEVWKVEVPR